MNREVKFRAYVKSNNQIAEVRHITFYKGDMVIKVFDEPMNTEVWLDSEDVDLLQFTGLHDKNGVEIYEGDIVGVEFGDIYHYSIVKYSGWYWYADMVYVKDIIQFEEFCDERDMSADCDVLGNIYENPDLLKGATDAEHK